MDAFWGWLVLAIVVVLLIVLLFAVFIPNFSRCQSDANCPLDHTCVNGRCIFFPPSTNGSRRTTLGNTPLPLGVPLIVTAKPDENLTNSSLQTFVHPITTRMTLSGPTDTEGRGRVRALLQSQNNNSITGSWIVDVQGQLNIRLDNGDQYFVQSKPSDTQFSGIFMNLSKNQTGTFEGIVLTSVTPVTVS